MQKMNSTPKSSIQTTITAILVLWFVLGPCVLGLPFFSLPFSDPASIKVMGALSILIVLFGGMGAAFVSHLRPAVVGTCAIALGLCHAIGLAIAYA